MYSARVLCIPSCSWSWTQDRLFWLVRQPWVQELRSMSPTIASALHFIVLPLKTNFVYPTCLPPDASIKSNAGNTNTFFYVFVSLKWWFGKSNLSRYRTKHSLHLTVHYISCGCKAPLFSSEKGYKHHDDKSPFVEISFLCKKSGPGCYQLTMH
jgi:hypothetical protein